MKFEVTILGNNSASPAFNRHPTSQVLNINESLYLLDCGEATQMQMAQYKIRRSRINHIFITHLHGDHYFGLIGLITSYNNLNRETALHIYGPPQLLDIINIQLNVADTVLRFPLLFYPVDAAQHTLIFQNENIMVYTIPMQHRIPCCGYLFQQKEQKRTLIREKITEYQVPVHLLNGIKAGLDYTTPDGSIISNAILTADPQPARSYAFCSDTIFTLDYIPYIQGCNTLYHESTFTTESEARAKQTFHSTAWQAATIAAKAGVQKLLIGHYSSKYEDISLFENEARPIFPEVIATVEGVTYSI